MRRRRNKLEVSTFPFLAVLLCIMGSLLLLLFIMDRRGKIAARYRVAEELQAREKRTKEQEDARQAEWDKAKKAMHQSLLAKHSEVAADVKGVQQQVDEASKKQLLAQAKSGELAQKLNDEAARIVLMQLELENQRAGLKQADKKESRSKAELLEAARELAEIELAFRQMKELKDREKQTYSVVPYRGKRGDSRTPIYVECVREGVLVHPEKKLLKTWDLSVPDTMREEVERRHGPLAIQKGKPSSNEPQGPYVLFLVRPSGIGSYYAAVSALKGYQLDFGYELIDADWALDFGGATHAQNVPNRKQVPWKHGDEIKPNNGPPLTGALPDVPSFPVRPPGAGLPDASLFPVRPPGGIALGPPGSSSLPALPPAPTLGAEIGQPKVTGNPSLSTGGGAGQPKGPSFVPIGKNLPPAPIATSGAQVGKPSGGGAQEFGPINVPIPGNNVGGPRGGSSSPTEPGESSIKPLPSFGSDVDKKPPPAPPLSRVLGNKDFIITVECKNDAVTVTPGSFTYRWTASNLKDTDDALVETVKNLIARRQASVRPGEPPYRPIIRFQVSSEGLRTYYHVYPLLGRLPVAAMTRENIAE